MIEKLKPEVDKVKERGKTMNEQQKFLETEVVYFASIESLNQDFTYLSKLWYGF